MAKVEEKQRQQAEEKQRQQAELKAELTMKKATLKFEQDALKTELANLNGLFTGKRRREINTRLLEIEMELKFIIDEERNHGK